MEKMMQRRNALGLIGSGIVGMVGLSTSAWAQATGDMASDLAGNERQITIWRDPGCGCCDAYGDYLEEHGFTVTRVLCQRSRPRRHHRSAAGNPSGDNGYHLAGNARERAGHGCGQVRHAKDLCLWPRRNFNLCR